MVASCVCLCVCMSVFCVWLFMCRCLGLGGSAVDGASVVVDLCNGAAASLYALADNSSSSGSGDWQASSHIGVVEGVGV